MKLASPPVPRNAVRWLLVAALAAGGVGAAAPAQAVSSCPTVKGVAYHTCVTSVTLSRTAASVRGAGTVPLTAAIGIHSDTGVPTGRGSFPNGGGQPRDLYPELEFTGFHSGAVDRVGLVLISGDAHDGIWSGTLNVSVLDAGTMTTAIVEFGGLGSPAMSYQTIPPALRRSVVVTATQRPRFASSSLFFQPDTVRYKAPFAVMGRVVDAQTGAGMPRMTVHVSRPDAGCECLVQDLRVTTDSQGNWIAHVPQLLSFDYVANIFGPVNSDGMRPAIAWSSGGPAVIGVVSAALSSETAHPGDPVVVTGFVGPAGQHGVVLQEWVNHTWRQVATTTVRASGRFTVPAHPTSVGRIEYRVVDDLTHAVSASIFLQVT